VNSYHGLWVEGWGVIAAW